MFTADHGDMTGDQDLWRKSYAYEPSARIPLIVRWPKGHADTGRTGQAFSQPCELRDIPPTFLEAASASQSERVDGQSLLDIVRGQAGWRPFIDLEHDVCYSPDNHWNALTDGRMKYIFHARSGEEQLFDLESDPYELSDMATANPRALADWRDRLVTHLTPRGERWVKDGRLMLRPESQLYSPHYPTNVTIRPAQ